MKYIRRVSKVKNDDTKGYIINSTNVEDKEKNTYSANVIDNQIGITLVEPLEFLTISEGFTLLVDSNIYKDRNRYFGDITIQKDEGNFDEWGNTVATFKKTMIGMCNTGCFLCAGQWNTNVVGHCFIGKTEISVANKTGVNNYNIAKIKFDVVAE